MTLSTKFWALGISWMIGGIILLSLWAAAILGDEAFLYLFAWLIIIGSLNYLLIRCPHCGKSAYFVRRFIYKGWPNRKCQKYGAKIR